MTDVEQVFQLVVDFLRRKGFVAIATKLENSERAKIGKLSDAPTRLEALLLQGIALEQESKSWSMGEEDGESSNKTPLDAVKEDDDETSIIEFITNKNTLPKHVKSKAKQMGLSKSMTNTSFRTLTPLLSTTQRSDAPAVSILARATDANKAVIRLPSRVSYRHSREPHTPLRTLNKERRAASVYVNRQSNELPLVVTPNPENKEPGTDSVTLSTLSASSPLFPSSQYENPLKISETLEEHSEEDGLTIEVQGKSDSTVNPKPTNETVVGPNTRGLFEIYPKPEESDSESDKESESEEDVGIEKDSKIGTDSSIFSMDLEDAEPKPDPKPSKRLNFSIKTATNIIPPKSSSKKKKPTPWGFLPLLKRAKPKQYLPILPPPQLSYLHPLKIKLMKLN